MGKEEEGRRRRKGGNDYCMSVYLIGLASQYGLIIITTTPPPPPPPPPPPTTTTTTTTITTTATRYQELPDWVLHPPDPSVRDAPNKLMSETSGGVEEVNS